MVGPPWIVTHGRVVIGGRALGFPSPTIDRLVANVREFHRESALTVLVRLNLALTHHTSLDQARLVRDWLPDLAERLLRAMKDQKATEVFYEAQVLNLIRLVLLHAPPDAGRRCNGKGDFALLVRMLLELTDLLIERDERVDRDQRSWVFSNFTRTELFMHDEHLFQVALARDYDLFVLVPRLLKRRGHRYDLPQTFAHITGLSIEDYLALGFALLSHYDAIDPGLIGQAEIGVHRGRYLADVRISAELRDRLWPLVAKPLDEYRAALQAEWDGRTGAARWAAMTTFTQFPMIEMPSGSLVALSRRFLRDRITHGIYWIIVNGLRGHQRQEFTNFFGHVFESYICRSLIRAAGRGFRRGIEYDGADAGKRPEGALITPRSVALIEAKARRLLLDVRELGGEATLRAAVEPGMDEAADQLATAIDAGQRRGIKGIATGDETRYHPIIVTYEPLPSHPLALRLYEEIIYRNERLRGKMVKPVTLLNTRDVEALEAIIQDGSAWPDFMTRKHTERHADDSFHNYVYRAFDGAIPRNQYLRTRWERVGDMVGMRLFGQPLDHPADDGGRHRHRRRARR